MPDRDSAAPRLALPRDIVVRVCGPSFNHLLNLSTPRTAAQARELLRIEAALAGATESAKQSVRDVHIEERALERKVRKALEGVRALPEGSPSRPEFAQYAALLRERAAAEARLADVYREELDASRKSLRASARTVVGPYLVFNSHDAARAALATPSELEKRNAHVRNVEQHLWMYLQRLCAKNDTFSEYGPTAWARVAGDSRSLTLTPRPGIAAREATWEVWAVEALVQRLLDDPDARVELLLRVNPLGRIEGDGFFRDDLGTRRALSNAEVALLRRIDGATPAHLLDAHVLAPLLHDEVVVPALLPAFVPDKLEALRELVSAWREAPARARWLGEIETWSSLAQRFVSTLEPSARMAMLTEAEQLTGGRERGARRLYAATNPLVEECRREAKFELGQPLIDELLTEAAPWTELWRDTFCYAAHVATERLAQLYRSAPRDAQGVPLLQFFRECEAAGVSLRTDGLPVLANQAFVAIKEKLRERLADRLAQPQLQLTAEDCAVVRRSFEFKRFESYTAPSLDLQLAAESPEAVANGAYQWVVGELHGAAVPLQHCVFKDRPDVEAFRRAYRALASGLPSHHFGEVTPVAHTMHHFAEVLGDAWCLLGRVPAAGAKWVPPARARVVLDETEHDLLVFEGPKLLGSLTRNFRTPGGFHPFSFVFPPHTPRLLCGNVVVQRRAWVLEPQDLPEGDYAGDAPRLAVAIEALRAKRGLPRFIFVRPTERVVSRFGAAAKNVDVKPIYIDLESTLAAQVLAHWFGKYGELDATEMFPAPNQLVWREPDGPRCFELRTQSFPAR